MELAAGMNQTALRGGHPVQPSSTEIRAANSRPNANQGARCETILVTTRVWILVALAYRS